MKNLLTMEQLHESAATAEPLDKTAEGSAGVVKIGGEEVTTYEFDRDSDAFWVEDAETGKGQKALDTKQEMLDYVAKHKDYYLKK